MSSKQAKVPREQQYALLNALGEDLIFSRLADEKVKDFCESVGIHAPTLYGWLDLVPGRRQRYGESKKAKAERYVEEAMEILDEGEADNTAQVALLKARSEVRRWIAQRMDRAAWGNDAKVNIGIGVQVTGEDYLGMLRQSGSMSNQKVQEISEAEGDAQKWRLLQAGLIRLPGLPEGAPPGLEGLVWAEEQARQEPQEAEYEIVEDEESSGDDDLVL